MAKAKKHSAASRGSKRLQRFAKNHGLDIQDEDDERLFARAHGVESQIDYENLNNFSPLIRLGDDAVIVDPNDDPLLVDIWGSTIAVTRALRKSRVEDPLLLTLFRERKNSLYESIGFDVSSYDNGSGSPNNPNSSNWGRVLDRVGLRYFDGDDETISFLFPSQDKASVALALALAGSFESE